MTAPLVSVVMSVYNGEEYLRQSIDSILNQTFTDLELVLIDDGSTDKTKQIIQSYKDDRIIFISRENRGLVASLNEGIKKARGFYIARQDDDDISLPTRLEKQIQAFHENADLVVCGTFAAFISQGGAFERNYATPFLAPDLSRRLFLGSSLVHGSVMIRKEELVGAGAYREEAWPAEDYDLWLRLTKYKIEVVPEVLYEYRLNNDGISATNSDAQVKSSELSKKEAWKFMRLPRLSAGLFIKNAARYQESNPRVIRSYIDDQKGLLLLALKHRRLGAIISTSYCYTIGKIYERVKGI